MANGRIIVRGGGDLGSGVVARLHRSGFEVVVLELPEPLVVRRSVAFAEAVFAGVCTVDGMTGRRVASSAEALAVLAAGMIPVLVDAEGDHAAELDSAVLIDARMLKGDPGSQPGTPEFVVGLGPGFEAGRNCHAVVETNRGHDLGRVIWRGTAQADTGQPGEMCGEAQRRIVRASQAGIFVGQAVIGEHVTDGQVLGRVDGLPVRAELSGMLRGLVYSGLAVSAGMKIGDVDPRARREYCFSISDKSLAIGGGALEAVLAAGYRPASRAGARPHMQREK
jgi:xanthine dehydrogenase accessory factor